MAIKAEAAAILRQAKELITPVTGGIRVAVRVTPRATANRISGLCQESNGTMLLKVAVTAVPEAGKANAAVIRLLARTWRLPQHSLSVITGSRNQRKVLLIAGVPSAALVYLYRWIVSQCS